MPASPDSLKAWVDAHGPAAVSRVAKRIERFSGNTADPATADAAKNLIELINHYLPS